MRKFQGLRMLLLGICALLLTAPLMAQIEDIQVGTLTRRMLVFAPSGIEPNRPLLISMHGMNQDIPFQQNQTRWESIARESNFVVVYPAGINNRWSLSGTTDTDFILAIIDEMSSRYEIDRNRVYLSGFSMGGMMSYYAATVIADRIACLAPVGGYLMRGPNTNSSRPMPIIHTHGTTDDVVPFSGVQTCLDAWIIRNNCPTTARITQPFPANRPGSNGTLFQWGPGTDSVEVALIRLQGVGHWHSIDPNGVHTSREIWNFCQRFSLDFGISKFELAYVNDTDPKKINVYFSLPLRDTSVFEGFQVKIDGQVAGIDTIVRAEPKRLEISLNDSILNIHDILLSYDDGNVFSLHNKPLVEFGDTLVDNRLFGASPRIVELLTTANGDTLMVKHNMKMQLPADISTLTLNAEFEGSRSIPILETSFYRGDSTILAFSLGEVVFADYRLLLSYSGSSIASVDSGLLKPFANLLVTNRAQGLPVSLVSAHLQDNAYIINLGFSKSMRLSNAQLSQLSIQVNGASAAVREFFVLRNTIQIILSSNLYHGDSISISYTPGDIAAADNGLLVGFSNFAVTNPLPAPTWQAVPGRIEAENFTLQFGTSTETTSDTGAGLNVGWTESGDWLAYAIENNTSDTIFDINFRVAAQAAGGRFDLFVNGTRIGQVSVPGTGGWQSWRSVVRDITIGPGRHYLRIVVVTGGFNLNSFDITEKLTGVEVQNAQDLSIHPNPASSGLVIRSNGFQFDRIDIIDAMSRTVISRTVPYAPELYFPFNLPNGVYAVRLSNSSNSLVRKIVVKNE